MENIKYTIPQAVEHLHNGGAIELEEEENLNLLNYILLQSSPETKTLALGTSNFYFLDKSGNWCDELTTDKNIIKLSQITESTPTEIETIKQDYIFCDYCNSKKKALEIDKLGHCNKCGLGTRLVIIYKSKPLESVSFENDIIKLYDEYLEFLNDANEAPISIAHNHGWKCPKEDIDKGEDFRNRIEFLKSKIM